MFFQAHIDTLKNTCVSAWHKVFDLWSRCDLRAQFFIFGILAALAHPPFGFWPGLLAYLALYLALDRFKNITQHQRLKKSFVLGFLAGFGYFLISCFWVYEAFLVESKTYGWMAPFAVVFLAAIPALFWGCGALIFVALPALDQRVRHISFAIVFALSDMSRGLIFTGFPWNPIGASIEAGSHLSQLASLFGVYGLSIWLLVVVCGLWPLFSLTSDRKAYFPLILSVVMLGGGLVFGAHRLSIPLTPNETVYRLVQANVSQKIKWDLSSFKKIFEDYEGLSTKNTDQKNHPDVIVWPEGALPVSAEELFSFGSWTAPRIVDLLYDDQFLIMGSYHSDHLSQERQVWRNSMLILKKQEGIIYIKQAYAKYKLVPFGEFIPFEDLLKGSGIKSLANIGDSYTAGPRTKPLYINGLPIILPLICYEGIFPSLNQEVYTATNKDKRPEIIINISNDAWFGQVSGPRQHLNLTRFRAIEEATPLIRSTPTGITGSIDPLGRIAKDSRISSQVSSFIDVRPTKRLNITPYSQLKETGIIIFSILVLILLYFYPFVNLSAKRMLFRFYKAKKEHF